MSASKLCKQHSLKSLKELSETCSVAVSTLQDWYKTKPKLFECVVIGASIKSKSESSHEKAKIL